uniref:HTH_48 domain-containing protein n=1 Tax=Heterorhabditis bacteriophora TaxID=37862 RepID=A0A1I7X667_HETBA
MGNSFTSSYYKCTSVIKRERCGRKTEGTTSMQNQPGYNKMFIFSRVIEGEMKQATRRTAEDLYGQNEN